MPGRNLPTRYNRLDDQITGPVVDAIVIEPHSRGVLRMPGEWSTDNEPPAHKVECSTTDTDDQGAGYEERALGGPGHYVLTYHVRNDQDSLSTARIILTGSESARAT